MLQPGQRRTVGNSRQIGLQHRLRQDLGQRQVAKRNYAQTAILKRSNVTGRVGIVLFASVWPCALPLGIHHIENLSMRRESHDGRIPTRRNLLNEFH